MNFVKLSMIFTLSLTTLISTTMAQAAGQNPFVCTYEKAESVYFNVVEKQVDILKAAQTAEDSLTVSCEPFLNLEWQDGWTYDYFEAYMQCTTINGRTKHNLLSLYTIYIDDQSCALKKIKLNDEF